MIIFLIIFAILAGMALPTQFSVNAQLRSVVHSPIIASTVLIPRLGATATVAYILAGQMVASTLIDHFGLIGVHVHSLSIPRVIGVVLIIVGVIIIQKF